MASFGCSRALASASRPKTLRPVVWGAIPMGNFLGGVLGSSVGIVHTFWIGGSIALLGCVAVWLSPIGRLRGFPAHASYPFNGWDERGGRTDTECGLILAGR